MSDFKTYMSLTNLGTASDIIFVLKNRGIEYKVEDTSKNFDPSFSLNSFNKPIIIFLKPIDFEKANIALNDDLKFNKEDFDDNHFLFNFNDNELLDVIKNPEEWHPLDVKLALKILEEREIIVIEQDLKEFNDKKIEELKKPEKNKSSTIILGYIFAILGGVLGFFIALHLINFKKTLPDGKQTFWYSENDRKHGLIMLYLASISLITIIIISLI